MRIYKAFSFCMRAVKLFCSRTYARLNVFYHLLIEDIYEKYQYVILRFNISCKEIRHFYMHNMKELSASIVSKDFYANLYEYIQKFSSEEYIQFYTLQKDKFYRIFINPIHQAINTLHAKQRKAFSLLGVLCIWFLVAGFIPHKLNLPADTWTASFSHRTDTYPLNLSTEATFLLPEPTYFNRNLKTTNFFHNTSFRQSSEYENLKIDSILLEPSIVIALNTLPELTLPPSTQDANHPQASDLSLRLLYDHEFFIISQRAPTHKREMRYRETIIKYSAIYNFNPNLIMAIIRAESNFTPSAISPRNAIGLMQVVPESAGQELHNYWGLDSKINPVDLFNGEKNILYGTTYLHILSTMHFNKVLDPRKKELCMISAYNAGPSAVLRNFSRNKTTAIEMINTMDIDALHYYLTEEFPFSETRAYLAKVLKYEEHYNMKYPSTSIANK